MFVAFNKDTTVILQVFRNGYWQDAKYQVSWACKKAIEKAAAKGHIKNADDYAVLPMEEFRKIEKTETVYSLMTGAPIVQSVNTPRSCDPSTELYWSM